MEVVGKFIAVVVTIVALFIGPTLYITGMHDEVTMERVKVSAVKFSDEVREQGKITKGMYEGFIADLDATGNLYDIQMVYSKEVVVPGETAGEVSRTEESFYTDDIVAGIYNGEVDGGAVIDSVADGEVHFNVGGYFSLTVTNRGETMSQKVAGLVRMRSAGSPRIEVHAGGEIRDENW